MGEQLACRGHEPGGGWVDRLRCGQDSLRGAGEDARRLGRAFLARSELLSYGAALFNGDSFFALPAFPLEDVFDPTGAGDSFAGGFLGYLAAQGDGSASDDTELRRAMTYGSVFGSFCVKEFGTERVSRLTRDEIDERYEQFRRITAIEGIPAN